MAKMYYNVEEATARLGCTEDQLRGLVRSGKLREFRDAGKLNYRVDEVDKLVATTGDNAPLSVEDSGELMLTPDDSGDQPAPSKTGSGSGGFALEEADAPIDLGGSSTSMAALKSGTGSGADLRLSDTDTGKEPPKTGSGAGADILRLDEVDREVGQGMRKDDTVITNIGISVFDDDDLEIAADPRAKTLMTGADEHLGLDGSGGGSGLLDLTRESDDTSLGAELLDGIDTGGEAETVVSSGGTATQAEAAPVEEDATDASMGPAVSAPVVVLAPVEPVSPAFTGLLIAAAITLALLGAMNIANTLSTWPSYLGMLAENFWFFLAGTVLLGAIFAGVGYFVGQPRAPRAPKAPKAPKEKKPKAEKGKKG